jgi:esterase/lipase superfamily enzyme
MADYVICARNHKGKKFGSEPGPSSYLVVPEDAGALPEATSAQLMDRDKWAKRVIADASKGLGNDELGHVLVFVHGYNNGQKTVMQRHRRIRDDLRQAAFKGVVVSFDWPSGDVGAFYLEDLIDANRSALQLVQDGIVLLADLQQPDCEVNIHLLAHSMGAYVLREAFTAADDADDLGGKTWHVSQVLLIAADISSRSTSERDHRMEGLYRNCTRLTCYSNRHDGVLSLSNFKRAGIAPRVGRHGLPDAAPAHAINVDCSNYWKTIPKTQKIIGSREHSWHIGDPVFARDMVDTLNGVDRESMTTRKKLSDNRLELIRPV